MVLQPSHNTEPTRTLATRHCLVDIRGVMHSQVVPNQDPVVIYPHHSKLLYLWADVITKIPEDVYFLCLLHGHTGLNTKDAEHSHGHLQVVPGGIRCRSPCLCGKDEASGGVSAQAAGLDQAEHMRVPVDPQDLLPLDLAWQWLMMTKGGGQSTPCALSPRPARGAGGADCWWVCGQR